LSNGNEINILIFFV